MPTKGGKSVNKRKGHRRRGGSKAQVQALVAKAISARAEKKYFLDNQTAQSMTYSGAVYDLSEVPQGDDDVSRDGDSLYIRSVRVLGRMANAGGAVNHIRVIVFQWRDDSTPTASSVLIPGYLGTVLAPLSLYTHDQRRKYNVMYDKKFTLDTSGKSTVLFDTGYLFPTTKKISFTSGTTTGNDKLWLLVVSDTASATYPALNYVSRLTFNDM